MSLTTIIIIIIIIAFFFMNPTTESFTPGLKKIYRPYIRNARVRVTKLYDDFTKKTRVLFAKIGVI